MGKLGSEAKWLPPDTPALWIVALQPQKSGPFYVPLDQQSALQKAPS